MVRRAADGRIALPMRIRQDSAPVAETLVPLSPVEAELLHAQLCHALDGEPIPEGSPNCRYSVQGDPRRPTPRRPKSGLDSPWATER
ncbi:hypothetical protein [Streptomyces cucumeris]|uniref:hypothetical protein n=1 Tax=Streptomyces cucumeris TaxID=2962890 RepID=UPI0020C87F30|nr:hypothetical protein [Streptomyces sp. NEAU-Y11]MCP9207116.1 hypothetical protein [Streptomyces sp. NEAU-Y11]